MDIDKEGFSWMDEIPDEIALSIAQNFAEDGNSLIR
jgi:hypothetical protein